MRSKREIIILARIQFTFVARRNRNVKMVIGVTAAGETREEHRIRNEISFRGRATIYHRSSCRGGPRGCYTASSNLQTIGIKQPAARARALSLSLSLSRLLEPMLNQFDSP